MSDFKPEHEGWLYKDVKRAQERSAELAEMSDAQRVDRLRAELAELAEARRENEEFRSEYGELEVKLENCEAELAEAYQATDVWFSLVQKTKAELAAKDARIAHERVEGDKISAALEMANVRIAELERYKRIATTYHEYAEVIARAERADAERDQANESAVKAWEERDQYLQSNVKLKDEILRLRAELKAMREALEPARAALASPLKG